MYTHVQTHPSPARYGNESVCGKIYFANSVGRWTCVILPKKASSITFPCHNMYKHLQHLPKMVVVVCGKMDLVVFEKYLGTYLSTVSSIGELEPPNSGFKSLESTIGRL
jgi:hypothetical protein